MLRGKNTDLQRKVAAQRFYGTRDNLTRAQSTFLLVMFCPSGLQVRGYSYKIELTTIVQCI